MESIEKLLSFLFNFTLVGAFLFFLIKGLQYQRNVKAKNELQKLQAHISQLRIALKSKVKQRTNSFRVYFSKAVLPGESLEPVLNQMLENKFDNANDFQSYLEQVQAIHDAVVRLPLTPENSFERYAVTDQPAELLIFKLIKEMKETSTKFNSKAENFNKQNLKNKIPSVDSMQFGAIDEVERRLKMQIAPEEPILGVAS